jgi:hypothetical protein
MPDVGELRAGCLFIEAPEAEVRRDRPTLTGGDARQADQLHQIQTQRLVRHTR